MHIEPSRDCGLCPRLVDVRIANQQAYPDWHNAPVPSFGARDAWLLIVGLAPGLKGANRTGRPFTGDFAGNLLYNTLVRCGLARGEFRGEADDDLELIGCRITNAVRCVPPVNRPTAVEVSTCNRFLAMEIASLDDLRAILALGTVAHGAVLEALGLRRNAFPFAHGAIHHVRSGLVLADSYHCSRQNTNTGRLTAEMFATVFQSLQSFRPA